VSAATLVAGLVSCSDAPSAPGAGGLLAPPGATEGTLERYVATFDDGHSERWYSLQTGDGSPPVRLAFDGPPRSQSGARIRVWGDAEGGNLRVARYEELAPAPDLDVRAASKQETYAFVLVDTGSGVNITAAQAQTAFFSTTPADKSFADFYNESSFGQYTVTGDVVGPYTYPDTSCNTDGMANTVQPMIGKTYNHYVYYLGQKDSSCGFTGLAQEGSINRPAHNTWLNASAGCVVTAQEPGHNLGMMHSNTITCSGASFSSSVGSSCTIKEYGDKLTPMGSGCHQLNAYEKWYMGWLSGCNAVKVTASGTFNLVPPESQCPGGIQVLQIPLPAAQQVQDPEGDNDTLADYYVELRAPGGTFDTALAPGVYVYAADALPTTSTAGHTYILDMNPQTTAFDPLSQGKTYTDPGGAISITLMSVGATGATVQVTVPNATGSPTCIDGTPLSGSGPAACMATGSSSGSSSGSGSGGSSGGSSDGGPGSTSGSGSSSGSSSGSGGTTGSSGSTSGSSGTTSGTSSGTSSSGSSGSSGSSSGSQGPSGPAAGDAGGLDAFDSGQGSGGCACDAVGATTRRQPAWASLGLLTGLVWTARKKKNARRP